MLKIEIFQKKINRKNRSTPKNPQKLFWLFYKPSLGYLKMWLQICDKKNSRIFWGIYVCTIRQNDKIKIKKINRNQQKSTKSTGIKNINRNQMESKWHQREIKEFPPLEIKCISKPFILFEFIITTFTEL